MLEEVCEAALEGARAKGLDGLLGDCLGLNVRGKLVDGVVWNKIWMLGKILTGVLAMVDKRYHKITVV